MLRPRIIPCLLIHEGGLVKTRRFKDPKYVGDPINAVKIFNEKEADELVVLDIDASVNQVEPDYRLISHLAAECRMPLCYGGGVKTAEQAKRIIGLGVEKVAISSGAFENPGIIQNISSEIGKQSVVVVIDILKNSGFLKKGYTVFTHNGKRKRIEDPIEFAKSMQDMGAGEIVVNSISNDGEMMGYDIEIARQMKNNLKIPLTVLGGAGSLEHIRELIEECGLIGSSAGSLFVFKGQFRAVLINYPQSDVRDSIVKAMNLADR